MKTKTYYLEQLLSIAESISNDINVIRQQTVVITVNDNLFFSILFAEDYLELNIKRHEKNFITGITIFTITLNFLDNSISYKDYKKDELNPSKSFLVKCRIDNFKFNIKIAILNKKETEKLLLYFFLNMIYKLEKDFYFYDKYIIYKGKIKLKLI